MIAFLALVLLPTVVLFALVPVVAFGLMLESVTPAVAAATDAPALNDSADFDLDECVPSVA